MIGAISFGGGLFSAQASELHAASPTQQGNPDERLASFGALEGRLTPARPLGSLMVAGNIRLMSNVSVEAKKPEVPDHYRCDGKDGKPVPGWKFCPKKRGDDIVPEGGWKVAPKGPAYRFVSAKRQVLVEKLRQPCGGKQYEHYGPLLQPYCPYHPKYAFARDINFHFTTSQQEQLIRIHECEADWQDDGAPYWGGLQMSASFMASYGSDFISVYKKFGPKKYRGKNTTAAQWTHVEQMIVAWRGKIARGGFGPWPKCGSKA